MATQCNDNDRISNSNWRIQCIEILDSKQDAFNKIFCFVSNEVCETDSIKITIKNQLIPISFLVLYCCIRICMY